MAGEEDEKKRRPIIVETGADDPSTVSPPIVASLEPDAPAAPVPVMGQTAMGDVTNVPETPDAPDLQPGPAPYGADKPTKFVPPFPIAGESPGTTPPMVTPSAPAPAPVNIGPVTTTERTKVSAEAKAGQADQLAASHAAEGIAGREGAANVDTAQAQADLAKEEERQREIARRQELEDRAREQAKYQAGLAERDRILNDAEKESHRDYWSDKPAGARLLSVFSSALGEAVAVDTGRNGAQEFIDKEMARDDAKKQGILKQAIYRAGLKGADAKEAYDNGLMEIGLRKAAILDKLADHRASVLAAKGVPAAQAASDKLVNAAQGISAKLKTDFGEQLNVRIHSSNELQQKYKMESALMAQKLAEKKGEKDPSAIFSPATGKPFAVAPSPKEAEAVNGWLGSYSRMAGSLTEYKKLISEHGKDVILSPENRARLDGLHAQMLAEMNGLANKEGSVLRPAEIPFYENMIPKATGWAGTSTTKAHMIAKLDEVQKQLRRKNASVLNSAGVETNRDLLDRLEMRAGEVQTAAEDQ